MGLPPEVLATHQPELWAKHANAVHIFSALSTQWLMGPGGPVGLNYAALPVVLRLAGLRCGAADFQRLQVMERAALAWFAERAEQARK